jgi:hypothetical protein
MKGANDGKLNGSSEKCMQAIKFIKSFVQYTVVFLKGNMLIALIRIASGLAFKFIKSFVQMYCMFFWGNIRIALS